MRTWGITVSVNARFEYAVRYSYVDTYADASDPHCVDPENFVWSYLDGYWCDNQRIVNEQFENFAARHPDCLVELIRRPVGNAVMVKSAGSLQS